MLIKYKLKKDDVSKYNTVVETLKEAREGSYYEKTENKMEMEMTQKVIERYNNGDMLINVIIDSSILWKDGKEMTVPKKGKIYSMKMAETGEVIESSGSGPQSPPSFPNRDVQPGDVWTGEKVISVSPQIKDISLKTIYKFESIEKYSNFDCAKISINTEDITITLEEEINQTIGGRGITYFAFEEGKLIKSEINTHTITSLSDAEIKVTTSVIVSHMNYGSEKSLPGEFLFAL